MAIAALTTYGYLMYHKIYGTNVKLDSSEVVFYIYTGSDLNTVADNLKKEGIIKNKESFLWVANKKNYANHVHPGKYIIKNKLSNNQLVNKLRSGDQETIQLTFNNIRTLNELAGKVGNKLEADSAQLVNLLNDQNYIHDKYGLNKETIISMFIPNTYQFYWSTTEDEFLSRMATEYKKFWSDNRKQKANQIGLSQSEVATLASIVQQESVKQDEQPIIAGVYMNRIKSGIPLQADPTLIFAIGDFEIKRVLNKHKEINSPYNTYKHAGLPPGPICVPEVSALDAVLNYKKHNYFYFCAKEDFSGYHNFASSYSQHLVNARRYQSALNKRKIYS